jgi:hypothetical protein
MGLPRDALFKTQSSLACSASITHVTFPTVTDDCFILDGMLHGASLTCTGRHILEPHSMVSMGYMHAVLCAPMATLE